MAGNRKAAEKIIIDGIEEINPGQGNRQLYEKAFAKMSDADFEQFIVDLEQNKRRLAVLVPNFKNSKMTTKRNIELGKKYGFKFTQRIWMDNGDGSPKYLTPHEYLILELPTRRQAQVLANKISIPKNTNTIDDLTGQAAGESKGAKLSFPEVQVLAAQGLEKTLTELFKYRGGDTEGFRLMNQAIGQMGEVELADLETVDTEVESLATLRTLLTSMHLSNTL